jgi:hypothetical protein
MAMEMVSLVKVSGVIEMHKKRLKHNHFVTGKFVSRAYLALLRKSFPQNHNLQTAVELGVKHQNEYY